MGPSQAGRAWYGGHWKVTQYGARRFHDPVLVTGATGHTVTGDIVLLAVNDSPTPYRSASV
jgi:hypothetical protein